MGRKSQGMKTQKQIKEFVNENIDMFHGNKLRIIKGLDLEKVLRKKNPYLFKAKNLTLASDLIKDILDAYLSSSEEKIFGDFLEDLAVFVASITHDGWKSSTTGIDLEFVKNRVHYLVSVKSGPNWGNSSQQKKQEGDFQIALKVLKQSKQSLNVQPVLGICYGRAGDTYKRGYLKLEGQSFWNLIGSSRNLYQDIVEPLGYQAKQHNDNFRRERDKIYNKLSKEFILGFCTKDGTIQWDKFVKFNSGNL